LLIGVLASSHINQVQASAHQLGVQALAVAIVAAWAVIITLVLLKALDAMGILRVPEEVQLAGLDVAETGERAVNLWNMDSKRAE